jgi:hypothetical protein
MDHAKHLRERAERCFQLTRDVANQESRTQLEMFGRESAQRADNVERGQAALDGSERPSKHAPD